ncbi:hypothetical protein CBR_g21049 [Chara braunii]|uniref:Profilin n=1 Tax=Chara braunii TaxID=69332 RepID=A0A388L0F8_CHABU|nr:hypothetical protein CBR_g21049 [Chara braunii]|eukprot:GBG75804.1 hypothetical protein CBR_g21049 [Chara braunii]
MIDDPSPLASKVSRVVIFDSRAMVLAANFDPPSTEELLALMLSLSERSSAIRDGLYVGGKRFEVHRHHFPYVYGRCTEDREGIALCRADDVQNGAQIFGLTTYSLPAISAAVVPRLKKLCDAISKLPMEDRQVEAGADKDRDPYGSVVERNAVRVGDGDGGDDQSSEDGGESFQSAESEGEGGDESAETDRQRKEEETEQNGEQVVDADQEKEKEMATSSGQGEGEENGSAFGDAS